MNILLTHGYFLRYDEAERDIMMPYPPQGLLHVAAWLEKHGLRCRVVDPTFETFDALASRLKEIKPGFIGLYVNLMTRLQVLKIIRLIRESADLQHAVIFLGGPDTRHHAQNYLSSGADFCIVGEGEETTRRLILELAENQGKGIGDLKGLIYRSEDGKYINTGDPDLIEPVDQLPFPDFKNVPLDKYFGVWKQHHGNTSLTISTMRGCPFSCAWCSKAVYGRTCRRRSPDNVAEEIVRLQTHFHPDRYWFVDDVFTLHKSWMKGFAQSLEEHRLDISYECITRADQVDDEVVELLKSSGCFRIWLGAESGSQKVLDRMDRKTDAAAVREAIGKCRAAGIETGTFIMLGYPGEEEADIMETLRHLKKAKPDHFTINTAYPIPGTVFYEEVKDSVREPGRWGEFTDRELEFDRTYPAAYYRHAIRYMQNEMAICRESRGGGPIRKIRHKIISAVSRIFMYIYRLR